MERTILPVKKVQHKHNWITTKLVQWESRSPLRNLEEDDDDLYFINIQGETQ